MPRGDPRLAPVPVRLTPFEKDQLRAVAAMDDISLSEAARRAIQRSHRITPDDLDRKERAAVIRRLGQCLAELRRFGGLYALQAKTNRPVLSSSQADLDAAIGATMQLMTSLLR